MMKRKVTAMGTAGTGMAGTIFGWAFGDAAREEDVQYVDTLRREALENAKQAAASKHVGVEPGTETYTVLAPGETLVEIDTAPDTLVVRCTVRLVGPGSEKIHAEGPMNG
jgi:hypothetical protein